MGQPPPAEGVLPKKQDKAGYRPHKKHKLVLLRQARRLET